jgi:hypothetical protein
MDMSWSAHSAPLTEFGGSSVAQGARRLEGVDMPVLAVSQRTSVLVVAAAIGLVPSPSFAGGPTTPSATITVTAQGSPPFEVELAGVPTSEGNQLYFSIINAPDASWKLEVTMVGDYTTNPTSRFLGNMKFTNNAVVPRDISFGIAMPICPPITGGSLLGGAITLTLTSVGPGAVTCPAGSSGSDGIVQINADGAVVETIFPCPISLVTTGSGTITQSTTYGLPGPSMPGPATIREIGQSAEASLSGLDSLTVAVSVLFNDPNGPDPATCPGDLDGNGTVSASDITLFLSQWMEESYCPGNLVGDINADGIVDAADLLVLLGEWGPCS